MSVETPTVDMPNDIDHRLTRRRPVSLWQRISTNDWPLANETTMYIMASAMDYLMTFWLLHIGAGDRHHGYREDNPIAAYFLNHWGPFKGLLLFKVTMVLTVCGIAQIVYTRRPITARWLLLGATILVCFVVLYSLRLLLRFEGFL